MLALLSAATPVLLSALIGAFGAWRAFERNALLANVTAERAAWRSRIRRLGCELQAAAVAGDSAALGRLRVEFRLSLNPWDARDREIVALLRQLQLGTGPGGDVLERVVIRLELLLKHDWERAKAEASWFSRHRGATPSARASSPRAGVEALARFRSARPLDPMFDETEAL